MIQAIESEKYVLVFMIMIMIMIIIMIMIMTQAIESEKCTSIYGTPTMFVDILASARQIKPDVR